MRVAEEPGGAPAAAPAPETPAPRRRGGAIRMGVWVFHMALPLLTLWLLRAAPEADVIWEHHPSHFWLVLAVAGVNVFLSLRVGREAARRKDVRLLFVALAFLSSAGFLFLHALSTPAVLVPDPNAGFAVATPVGLLLASLFAVISSFEFGAQGARAVMERRNLWIGGLIALMALWALGSVLELAPLSNTPPPTEASGPLAWVAAAGVALYAFAAVRYFFLYRRRPSAVLIGIITSFVLLAEGLVVVVFAQSWKLSWWEWHLLLTLAYGFVAYSAHLQHVREGSSTGLFNSIAMDQTIKRVQAEYGAALETLVAAMQRGEQLGWTEEEMSLITSGLAARFSLTEGQIDVLRRAAAALANEREQIQRLDTLVAVGGEASVITDEEKLLAGALDRVREGFRGDVLRIGLVREGLLDYPAHLSTAPAWSAGDADRSRTAAQAALTTLKPARVGRDIFVMPLAVKGTAAGVLEVSRLEGEFAERDTALLMSLASQLSIALENARLYQQIDGLFRQYLSPAVATTLIADPSQAALGGAVVHMTTMFADLRGFTTFSERSTPEEVVFALNKIFGIATPSILRQGGTILQFVGDAIMAAFNAPVRQPDHALRAAHAALDMQRSLDDVALEFPDFPRFRVGINTGRALIGNIGSDQQRSYNAMGDAVNVAARLESIAQPGQVLIGGATYELIRDVAVAHRIGEVEVKGRDQPVETYLLEDLRA
jgi:class 3 adenylate cyclase